ncbi:MAG: hypothetical protein ACK55Z_25985, partial [bacterium]
ANPSPANAKDFPLCLPKVIRNSPPVRAIRESITAPACGLLYAIACTRGTPRATRYSTCLSLHDPRVPTNSTGTWKWASSANGLTSSVL